MRYFSWELHKKLIKMLMYLLLGIFLGMFICLYLHGQQLDQLHLYSDRLENELIDCKHNLNAVEEENKTKWKQQQLIRSVEFHFEEKLDPFIETELLKTLMDETYFLIGKKVDDVGRSPEFIYQLINNKSYKAKDKGFKLKVKVIYIQAKVQIWASVREEKIPS